MVMKRLSRGAAVGGIGILTLLAVMLLLATPPLWWWSHREGLEFTWAPGAGIASLSVSEGVIYYAWRREGSPNDLEVRRGGGAGLTYRIAMDRPAPGASGQRYFWQVGLALGWGLAAGLFAAGLAWGGWRGARRARRRAAGRCPACGYDLRGSAAICPECPECGSGR